MRVPEHAGKSGKIAGMVKQERSPGSGTNAAPQLRDNRRGARKGEFCCGPGDPYEDDCLGNGRIPEAQRGEQIRCPRCRVERRKQHMRQRNNKTAKPARRRERKTNRPKTFAEALAEAEKVLGLREAQERAANPAVKWQEVQSETNEGAAVRFRSMNLRHPINER